MYLKYMLLEGKLEIDRAKKITGNTIAGSGTNFLRITREEIICSYI